MIHTEMSTKKEKSNDVELKMEALLRWGGYVGISDSPCLAFSSSIPSSHCLGYSVVVSHFPQAGGRGLSAARDLREGELLLRVPREALLTTQRVLQDENVASFMKKYPKITSSQKLTICLLAEVAKGRGSWWYPYLVLLPLSYSTLPIFQDFEIQALQVEDAIWISEKAVVKAKLDWQESLHAMRKMELKPQLLSFRSWLWASATISSRTLHVPWDNAGCLCPIGDLFNYAAPDDYCAEDSHLEGTDEKQVAELADSQSLRLTDGRYEEDSASYCFYAKRNYKKGEQVLLSYGTYSNLDLLEHYGFLLSSNPNDKAFLKLDTASNISNTWPKDSLYIQPDGKPSFALLCTLRLGATPMNLRRTLGHLAYAGSFLSNESELLAMQGLIKHCRNLLEELPTTEEEDALLLQVIDKVLNRNIHFSALESLSFREEVYCFMKANGMHRESLVDGFCLTGKVMRSLERWRLAVQWRLCYKKILSSCVLYCSGVICELS